MKILSVVVPAYNVEKTLEATLTSLCVEEIIGYLDIIVVDDGSEDNTAAIAMQFANKYPTSVRLISQENGGHGATVNTGIKNGQGRYFKVVDGDDRLERDGFIALVSQLLKTQADIVAANYKRVDMNNESISVPMRFTGVEFGRLYRFDELPVDSNLYFGIHSITIKTSLLKDNDLSLQTHTFYVDAEYGLLPIPFVKTVEFFEAFVYLYYVGNPGQSVDLQNFVKRYDDHYRVVRRMAQYTQACGAEKPQLDYMYSVLYKLCFTNYMLSAFYDSDSARGRSRAREFDVWLKNNDTRLFKGLGRSIYIRLLRLTYFVILPRGNGIKSGIKKIYSLCRPLFKKKTRLTYR